MSAADFAFIVHSRDRSDLPRKFPWMKRLPRALFDAITFHAPPFAVSRVTGLVKADGSPATGIVIGIPMTARQLLEHRGAALARIVQAVKLARAKGASHIGLGAMTASLSKGGLDVIEAVKGVYVTTGRTYTVGNIVAYIEDATRRFALHRPAVTVAIVGAAGGIGSGVAFALARAGYRRFILVDVERKADHVRRHMAAIEEHADAAAQIRPSMPLNIEISHQMGVLSRAHIIVGATSAPEAIIRSEDVEPGTLIINDAQPSDVSPEIVRSREDVLVIEGGVLRAPGIDCHFNMGLAHRNDIFSCLAETLLLARRGDSSHYSLGEFRPDFLDSLRADAAELGFAPSPQNDLGNISPEKMIQFGRILRGRFKA